MKNLIKTCVFAFLILASGDSVLGGPFHTNGKEVKPNNIDLLELIREGKPLNEWPVVALIATAFLVFCAAIVAVSVFQSIVFGERCRKCRRKHALVKTGKTKVGERRWSEDDCVMYEWKCKYCDNLTWQEKPRERSRFAEP